MQHVRINTVKWRLEDEQLKVWETMPDYIRQDDYCPFRGLLVGIGKVCLNYAQLILWLGKISRGLSNAVGHTPSWILTISPVGAPPCLTPITQHEDILWEVIVGKWKGMEGMKLRIKADEILLLASFSCGMTANYCPYGKTISFFFSFFLKLSLTITYYFLDRFAASCIGIAVLG